MTAAIFGLVGVLVGAVIAAVGQYLLGVRNEYAAATVAARLIIAELERLSVTVQSGEIDGTGALDTPVWDKHQAALALVVPSGHWDAVGTAYTRLAEVRHRPEEERARPPHPSRFLQAADHACKVLRDATAADAPLHRRGSVLERRMARWPDP